MAPGPARGLGYVHELAAILSRTDCPVGTFLLVGLLGALASGLTNSGASVFAQNLFGALGGFIALGLFTFCLGPVSGAHLSKTISSSVLMNNTNLPDPTITLATFFTGLSTLPRTVLYISAQCIGAIIAGYWLRLGLSDDYFPHVSYCKPDRVG